MAFGTTTPYTCIHIHILLCHCSCVVSNYQCVKLREEEPMSSPADLTRNDVFTNVQECVIFVLLM
jgi:hypothetical protein